MRAAWHFLAAACWILVVGKADMAAMPQSNSGLSAMAPGCDLTVPLHAAFLKRVRAFYDHGVFEMVDVDWVSRFLVAREDLLPTCPVAALQALLLKLEENLVYEERAYETVMAEYVRYFHAAVLRGTLTSGDLLEWPLAQGLERTLAMSRALAEPVHLTSAMVMNFCQPEDRFGAVHALEWLLKPPFGPPDPSDRGNVGLLSDTDLFIYLVDAKKCTGPGESLIQRLRSVAKSVRVIPYQGGPEREEQTAYFKFLVDYYDSLPDFTIFTHPDADEHQGAEFSALVRALKVLRTQSAFAQKAFGYYPLALQMVVDPKRTWGEPWSRRWFPFWRRLFAQSWDELGYGAPACRWQAHPGKYIAGLVTGAENRTSRGVAKAACSNLDSCVGVTCGTPIPMQPDKSAAENSDMLLMGRSEGTCTARQGDPPGFLESPLWEEPIQGDTMSYRETSFAKHCAPKGDRAWAGATREDAPAATYSWHHGAYLADYAEDDAEERNLREARARCDALGATCAGVTCDASASHCTVRAGATLMSSPVDEVSYRKEVLETKNAPNISSHGGASSVFQFYTGSQSIVHKDRLLAWPQEAYAALGADGVWCSEMTGFLEAAWHVMFGEPLSQWPREHDPSLPLFLKFYVPSMFSYGDEDVI